MLCLIESSNCNNVLKLVTQFNENKTSTVFVEFCFFSYVSLRNVKLSSESQHYDADEKQNLTVLKKQLFHVVFDHKFQTKASFYKTVTCLIVKSVFLFFCSSVIKLQMFKLFIFVFMSCSSSCSLPSLVNLYFTGQVEWFRGCLPSASLFLPCDETRE